MQQQGKTDMVNFPDTYKSTQLQRPEEKTTRIIPNDASPEERENNVEKEWPPDDKVIDPGPVVRVQGKLKHTKYIRGKHSVSRWSQ